MKKSLSEAIDSLILLIVIFGSAKMICTESQFSYLFKLLLSAIFAVICYVVGEKYGQNN